MSDGGVPPGLRVWQPRPGARLRLLCLPPAGGAASFYRAWAALLPRHVELVAVELPGHGARYGEPFAASVTDAVQQTLDDLSRMPAGRWAVYGHSMGALLALEIAHALADQGRAPAALAVSSHDHPAVSSAASVDGSSAGGYSPDMPDEQLHAVLADLGGLEAGAFADRGLMEVALEVVRADIAILTEYKYAPAPALDCPVRAYAGVLDTAAGAAGLAGWRRENPRDFQLTRMPGGHFFFRGRESAFLTRLAQDLSPGAAPGPATARGRGRA